MTRAELIEKMARAMCDAVGKPWYGGRSVQHNVRWQKLSTAALAIAEREIVERAAKVVEDHGRRVIVTTTRTGQINRAYDCAQAIRNLMESDNG